MLVGGVSWRSSLRLLGLGCGCVGRRRDGECVMRVGAEVVEPLVREVEVARMVGECSCLVLWIVVAGRFEGVGELWEGCVWSRQTEVLE